MPVWVWPVLIKLNKTAIGKGEYESDLNNLPWIYYWKIQFKLLAVLEHGSKFTLRQVCCWSKLVFSWSIQQLCSKNQLDSLVYVGLLMVQDGLPSYHQFGPARNQLPAGLIKTYNRFTEHGLKLVLSQPDTNLDLQETSYHVKKYS